MIMGAASVNIPTVMFTGGYMAAGHTKSGKDDHPLPTAS